MAGLGQTEKSSRRVYVFRIAYASGNARAQACMRPQNVRK